MSSQKILVIGPSWLGDMVMAQKLFKVIKDHYPKSELHVASPIWTIPLVSRMPEVDKPIALPFSHGELSLFKRYQLGKTLKVEGYTQAIVLTNSFKSALIPFFANVPKRTGFLGEMRFGLINDRIKKDKSLYRTVDQFLALAPKNKHVKTSLSTHLISKPNQARKFLKGKLKSSDKILGIAPGAEYGEAKRWPVEYFAKVAIEAIENDWKVILLGSSNDHDLGESLDQLTKNKVINLIGKTKLEEVIDVEAEDGSPNINNVQYARNNQDRIKRRRDRRKNVGNVEVINLDSFSFAEKTHSVAQVFVLYCELEVLLYNSLVLTGRRIDESDYVGREEFIPLVNRQPSLQNVPGTEF
ncbi:MAG: ADP-heptose:LPS heptosyltransferase, partial [Pseudomonadota bacterium]